MQKRSPSLTEPPTPERSRLLGRVRHHGTSPEIELRRALHRAGLRHRLRYPLPGSPDLVLVAARLAIFVDGCFWHGCPLHGTIPKTNTSFWQAKIHRNRERDRVVDQRLRAAGWMTIRIWEHEIRKELDSLVVRVVDLAASRHP
ncbi:MAG TPA: very short patch repair endonuclease [Terriglobia bacterium]|nr:very short patch repair endonuclease [Terriglobia bacterium]